MCLNPCRVWLAQDKLFPVGRSNSMCSWQWCYMKCFWDALSFCSEPPSLVWLSRSSMNHFPDIFLPCDGSGVGLIDSRVEAGTLLKCPKESEAIALELSKGSVFLLNLKAAIHWIRFYRGSGECMGLLWLCVKCCVTVSESGKFLEGELETTLPPKRTLWMLTYSHCHLSNSWFTCMLVPPGKPMSCFHQF